ncbi:MAG: ABC transporter permease, partial [Lawsonibacter sp.]
LVLYSLLPVVHNTFLGLETIRPGIKEAARGMGLSKWDRLFTIELPLAFPMVFTGIRIATVTAVGVAVFATSVGGGGLGSVINQGIRTQNMRLILSSTITLMAMAVLFDSSMALIEKKLSRHTA